MQHFSPPAAGASALLLIPLPARDPSAPGSCWGPFTQTSIAPTDMDQGLAGLSGVHWDCFSGVVNAVFISLIMFVLLGVDAWPLSEDSG